MSKYIPSKLPMQLLNHALILANLCKRGLWDNEKRTGIRITLDSWILSILYLDQGPPYLGLISMG